MSENWMAADSSDLVGVISISVKPVDININVKLVIISITMLTCVQFLLLVNHHMCSLGYLVTNLVMNLVIP